MKKLRFFGVAFANLTFVELRLIAPATRIMENCSTCLRTLTG
jgi:hypothetical protein